MEHRGAVELYIRLAGTCGTYSLRNAQTAVHVLYEVHVILHFARSRHQGKQPNLTHCCTSQTSFGLLLQSSACWNEVV